MSRVLWGDDLPTRCDHGAPSLTCTTCRDERASNAVTLAVIVAIVFGLLLLGGRAFDRQAALDDAALRAHLAQLERAHPGATERLRALAAEQLETGERR